MGCFESKAANLRSESGPKQRGLRRLGRLTRKQREAARQFTLGAGKPPGYEDPTFLSEQTAFSVSEVEALYELFKKLSSSDDGLIHKEEFLQALFKSDKRESFVADRIFALFDTNRNGVIEFGEFVRALSIFHPKAREEDKTKFAFDLHDVGQKGFINREDVKMMLIDVLSESDVKLADEDIEPILDRTFKEKDTTSKKKGGNDEERDLQTYPERFNAHILQAQNWLLMKKANKAVSDHVPDTPQCQ